jgi:hypothetical protein
MTMNENAKKWVAALRSGEFKGTREQLAREAPNGERRYCCLGVACELYKREHPKFKYDDNGGYLPPRVQNWLGLRYSDGTYDLSTLAERNDAKAGFKKIADIIERQPKGLFK